MHGYCYYKLGIFNNIGGSQICCDTAYLCPIAFSKINNMYQNMFNECINLINTPLEKDKHHNVYPVQSDGEVTRGITAFSIIGAEQFLHKL